MTKLEGCFMTHYKHNYQTYRIQPTNVSSSVQKAAMRLLISWAKSRRYMRGILRGVLRGGGLLLKQRKPRQTTDMWTHLLKSNEPDKRGGCCSWYIRDKMFGVREVMEEHSTTWLLVRLGIRLAQTVWHRTKRRIMKVPCVHLFMIATSCQQPLLGVTRSDSEICSLWSIVTLRALIFQSMLKFALCHHNVLWAQN